MSADDIELNVQRISGTPLQIQVGRAFTLRDVKARIIEEASLGLLDVKLFSEDWSPFDDEEATVDEVGLANGSLVSIATQAARDYSQITKPEKVLNTGSYPAGILLNDSGELYVSHYYGDLRVYDKEFNFLRKMQLPMGEPKKLALSSSGELVVLFPRQVSVFDPTGATLIRSFGNFSFARGLALHGDRAFVGDTSSGSVHVYRFADGEHLLNHSPGLNSPYGLAVVDDRLLAVADHRSHSVHLLDIETLERKSVIDNFRYPTDVKVDASGNLLVMDTGNARVAVVQQDGSFVANVMEGFFVRSGCCNLWYNEVTGAIAISNDDGHNVTVLPPIFT